MLEILIFRTVEVIVIIGVAVAGVFVEKTIKDIVKKKKTSQRKELKNE